VSTPAGSEPGDRYAVALLTGGGDTPYAFGLATALVSRGVALDIVAGDDLDSPELRGAARVRFLNLRGNQAADASLFRKVRRILIYYARLLRYATTAVPTIFHILWNNKFEAFDRTLLTLYYKWLGKRIVLTAHNVNAGVRDGNDSWLNRATLRMQYRLADHVFVHTEKMKSELVADWSVPAWAVTVIPFGINNAAPSTTLTPLEAKERLGIRPGEKTILFFGTIAPYKGLEYLVDAFERLAAVSNEYRLVIAGKPRHDSESYWTTIEAGISAAARARVHQNTQFIPDEDTEIYFKAADVLVLPYTEIFQSGVLFLGYRFGLPVVATDVGSLRDDVVPGQTGFVCRPRDSADLARTIESYFASDLYADLAAQRRQIQEYAASRHSWDTVGGSTIGVYEALFASEASADAARKQPAL
jgi:D-inositol-3-phosphate glycosyltransferase